MIIVGHGSHLNAESSAPVYQHAAHVRATGHFDEVLEAFWKEEPSLSDALDLVESPEVYVVPLFLAEGYFTRQVVPRELGLDPATTDASPATIAAPGEPLVTRRGGRTIWYCRPIGTQPALAEAIVERARHTARLSATDRRQAALVVIGHGTDRSATSGDTVHHLVGLLRDRAEFGAVTCGFLDEDPPIGRVLASIEASHVVLVPFFLAEGWHTAETIPRDLGLTGVRTVRDGQTIWYTPPVGTIPEIADLVLAIARDAGAVERRSTNRRPTPGTGLTPHAARTPARSPSIGRARAAFFDWLDATVQGRAFLQLWIRRSAPGRYDLCHVDDVDTPLASLRRSSDPREMLEIARTAADGAYRPLRSANNLRPGWCLTDLPPNALWQAVSLAYPAAVLQWYRARTGELEVGSFSRWGQRQSGIYEVVRRLERDGVQSAIDACCASCLRHRRWPIDSADHDTPTNLSIPRHGDDLAVVPCLEPCTWFASRARDVAVGQVPAERATAISRQGAEHAENGRDADADADGNGNGNGNGNGL